MGGAAVAGRIEEGNGAFATGGADAAGRCAEDVACAPGSGVMILTAGVEAAVGNSALVGFPAGVDGASAATGAVGAGIFHDAA